MVAWTASACLRRRLQAPKPVELPQLSVGEEIALQREIFELRLDAESQMQQPGLVRAMRLRCKNKLLTCGGNSTTFLGFRRPALWSPDYG